METVLLVAVILMLLGVAGSVVPGLPSGLLSLAGVYTYWFFGEDAGIGLLALAVLTLLGVVAAVFEHFAGAITARAVGASNETMVYAAVVGFLLFLVTGPLGILLGIFLVVAASELRNGADLETAARRGLYTTIGVLGSAVVQLLLTLTILGGFLLAVLVL